MVALLKQKSKIRLERKPRVKYEIKNLFKRPKIDPSISSEGKSQLESSLGFSGSGKTTKKIEP